MIRNGEDEKELLMKARRNNHRGPPGIEKPLFSMAQLVGQALLSYPEKKKLQLKEITNWISSTYPYYRSRKGTLKDVRKVLSKYRYYVLESVEPNQEWGIAPYYRNVITKTAFIPRTINKETGHLIPVNLELEAKRLDSASYGVHLQQDRMLPANTLHGFEKWPQTSQLLTRRPFSNAIIKPEVPRNDDTTFIIKKERHFSDEEEEPSSQCMEALEMPREIKPENTIQDMENDSIIIDLTDDTEEMENIICPICDEIFMSNEKLGQHVTTHKRSILSDDVTQMKESFQGIAPPSVDVTRMKETFQGIASTVFGRDKNVPICVFTGNVYLTRDAM